MKITSAAVAVAAITLLISPVTVLVWRRDRRWSIAGSSSGSAAGSPSAGSAGAGTQASAAFRPDPPARAD